MQISGKLLEQSSGKMILVDKLLPKLKDAGRRVLIFSQVSPDSHRFQGVCNGAIFISEAIFSIHTPQSK